MRYFKNRLIEAWVPALYANENIPLKDVLFYGRIFTTALEGWFYNAYISEYNPDTWIAFWFVSWQAEEWGYIDLSEFSTIPIVLEEIYSNWNCTFKEVQESVNRYKQE